VALNLELLIDRIVNILSARYAERLHVVLMYGSRAKGTHSEKSDMEFIAIVEKKVDLNIHFEFRYQEIPIDLWTTDWDYLEDLANIDTYWCLPAGSFVTAQIVYTHSEKWNEKFNAIKKRLIHPEQFKDKNLDHATSKFSELYQYIGLIELSKRKKDFMTARTSCWGILKTCQYIIARINNQYFTENWGRNQHQSFEFDLQPQNFRQLAQTLASSDDFEEMSESGIILIDNMRELLIKLNQGKPAKQEKYELINEGANGSLEYANKIIKAAKEKDIFGVSYAVEDLVPWIAKDFQRKYGSWDRASELKLFSEYSEIYFDKDYPDFNPDITQFNFDKLKVLADKFVSKIIQEIDGLNDLQDLDEVANFLEKILI